MDVYEYLGLFYAHVAAQGNCLPSLIPYRDIVTGTEKTTSIKDVMNAAKDKAAAMMEAAYEYCLGRISKERFAEAIPGESLDTGRPHTATNGTRYTGTVVTGP